MPYVKCKICSNLFYARPAHLKNNWGIFCSIECKGISQKTGKCVKCFTCGRNIYRTPKNLSSSKSTKYFCSKSCQTKWRNKEFSGFRHGRWIGGYSTYRKLLKNSNSKHICVLCKTRNTKVLAVHHVDGNHRNNILNNLAWLCHNCHHLVHRDKVEKQKFLGLFQKQKV